MKWFDFVNHFYRYDVMKSCWAEDQYRRPSFKSLTSSLEKMLEKGNDYLQLDLKQFVNNMCYFVDGMVIFYSRMKSSNFVQQYFIFYFS